MDISVTARGLERLSLQMLCDKTDQVQDTNLAGSHSKKRYMNGAFQTAQTIESSTNPAPIWTVMLANSKQGALALSP